MGMLMAMTLQKQKEEAARKAAEAPAEPVSEVKDEEIPFAELPVEEPVRKQEKKPVRRTSAATRRRKSVK